MPLYQTTDKIPLAFMRISAGAAVGGLSVTVVVRNVISGSQLLASTALTEITTGVYEYQWTHGLTATTECVAIFTTGGKNFFENFTIANTQDDADSHAGRTA